MLNLEELTHQLKNQKASCLHLSAGLHPLLNVFGKLRPAGLSKLTAEEIDSFAQEQMSESQHHHFQLRHSVQTTAYTADSRIRLSFYRQRGMTNVLIRLIPGQTPSFRDLNLPDSLRTLAASRRGLIIVGGPAGSGKSTTLAALIELINQNRQAHIVTLEDPIEYFFNPVKALFSQREVGSDTVSFTRGLKEAIRQDPDVIMIGEMRDQETIQTALTAAETGMLVLASMYAADTVQTINRIIGAFAAPFQSQARTQLSIALRAIIIQQLVMHSNGTAQIPALEILIATPAIKNMIRDRNVQQIYSALENNTEHGMQSMDQSLHSLYTKKIISDVEALTHAVTPTGPAGRKLTHPSARRPQEHAASLPEKTTADLGQEMINLNKKLICYRANFTPGQEGFWTSSGTVLFNEYGMNLSHLPGSCAQRLYVSDFNIVSNRVRPFALAQRILVRVRVPVPEEQPTASAGPHLLQIKLFTQPEPGKQRNYFKIAMDTPLIVDEQWHTLVLPLPAHAMGKMAKIIMLEFPAFVKSVQISDIVFF